MASTQPPLTVLVGPSATLRDDVVRCLVLRRPGLVAVVYDVVPGGLVRRVLDSSGEQHREDVEACCQVCAVRQDAEQAVALVAGAERWHEVVLALPPSVGPEAVAGLVDVDTVTAVVDGRLLLSQLSGDDLLADRGAEAAPTDRRSTAELVVEQLEAADVIAVADLDRSSTSTARTVEALLAHLAPLALQVPLGPGGSGCDDIVSTGRRDLDTTPAQREQLAALARELCPPSCDVVTVTWSCDRPLHSGRLAELLPGLVQDVVRSRGHVWLADRRATRLRWESAGGSLSLGDPERWVGAAGSRLVLTGVGLDADALCAALDTCACDDAESSGATRWEDPFTGALGPSDTADA